MDGRTSLRTTFSHIFHQLIPLIPPRYRKRDRDLAFKVLNNPLTPITLQLAARSHSSSSFSKPQSHLLPCLPRSNAHNVVIYQGGIFNARNEKSTRITPSAEGSDLPPVSTRGPSPNILLREPSVHPAGSANDTFCAGAVLLL